MCLDLQATWRNVTLEILLCGRGPKLGSRTGNPHGAEEDLAGILSAPQLPGLLCDIKEY